MDPAEPLVAFDEYIAMDPDASALASPVPIDTDPLDAELALWSDTFPLNA
jgi:hypothetical protein